MRVVCLLIVALAALTFAATSHAAIVEGQDYTVLSPPQPTEPGKKVEIIEFFAYDSPRCNALDPSLTEWARTRAGKIIFKRVPVSRDSDPRQQGLQRFYYALEMMGKADEYQARIFSAIVVQRTRLDSEADLLDLAAKLGLDRGKLASFYNSFGLQATVRHVPQIMKNYRIEAWPTLVVDGKYVTSPALVGARLGSNNKESASDALLINVIDELVDQQLKARP